MKEVVYDFYHFSKKVEWIQGARKKWGRTQNRKPFELLKMFRGGFGGEPEWQTQRLSAGESSLGGGGEKEFSPPSFSLSLFERLVKGGGISSYHRLWSPRGV